MSTGTFDGNRRLDATAKFQNRIVSDFFLLLFFERATGGAFFLFQYYMSLPAKKRCHDCSCDGIEKPPIMRANSLVVNDALSLQQPVLEQQTSASPTKGSSVTSQSGTPLSSLSIHSYYRRKLPTPPCVPFSSMEGRQLFAEALANRGMECYWKLAEQFHTQEEPAFCGLGTLVMVLNALSIDPRRQWKGVWRWFSEEMLECCVPLEEVRLCVFVCGV